MHFGGWIVVRADSAHGHLRYLASNVLPGGEAVLINIYKSGRDVRLGIVRLADGTVTDLGISGANAEYLHTAHIVFGGLDRSIRAAPFSLRRKRITGPIVAVDEHPTTPGRRRFSPAGTLAYVTRSSRATRLMMVDRRGNTSTFADRVELFSSPRFSPDGRRLAVYAATNPPRRIWVYGLESRTFTPLSGAIPGSVGALGWTPDGQHVAFTSGTLTPGGPLGIRWQVWDGSAPAQAMLPRKIATSALAFGPPHSYMVFQEGGRLNGNLWIAPLDS
ncbi:MAG: TolB family protein, partial [Longimicrobiales bacterium]